MASPSLRLPPPSRKRRRRDLGSAATATRTSTTAVSPLSDVIFEILSWLPAKSLGRCRCVSTKWRDLISNPAFVATHRSRAEPLLIAMIDEYSSSRPSFLQLMDTEGTVVKVVSLAGAGAGAWKFHASLDRLACITFGDINSYALATGVTLPNIPKPAVEQTCGYSTRCFGFGRTAKSHVYKLICLDNNTRKNCEVLTLGDAAQSKWRQTQSPPMTPSLRYECTSGVTVNGVVHFLSHDGNYVLCFDLESEEWKVIHGPEGAARDHGQDTRSIAELNGTLCMSRIALPVINVWLLSDSDMNIWIKAYTIPTDRKDVNFVVPLRVLRLGGELLFNYYGFDSKPNLQLYVPRFRRCKDVETYNLIGKIGICCLN